MRFSNVATLFTIASIAEAAPALFDRPHAFESLPSSGGYQAGIFYVNWAIYGRKHFVTDLPYDKLTKINYAFANLNNVTGEVFLTDEWADLQFQYPGDAPGEGTQLYGNFNQLFKLKQKNQNLKVALSVGGWSYRNNFSPGLNSPEKRLKFCSSSLKLIADLGLDALDIDWEYPADDTDAANLVSTAKVCRKLFDEYAAKYAHGYHFDITISAPAGPQHYVHMPVRELDQYIDGWNLMAFDYQGGGFSNFTGHQSNVYPSRSNPKTTDGWVVEENRFRPFNTKEAVDYYKSNIADSTKLQLGLPLYGRSFGNVIDLSKEKRGLAAKFNGTGSGTWEAGVLDQKVLPLDGSKVYTDKETIASWSWDAAKKEFVSFDNPKVSIWKTEYLKQECLGGAWFWESSGDLPYANEKSSIRTVVKALGGERNLRLNQNNLYYPQSKYNNVRDATNVTALIGSLH
ncbi:glycoside hydrolase family 18 protein [Plenodomus tracheiphilus IPT5]|uniref:chitinase n=1 Tax=Plenodomus tracheiphilus IPT5 TaxID=1408161 RepID=A0A6A7B0Z0_9PLEO|nr:glycoside hydrolase family 18 protein [Plenodomus tracheiphilus IPT5]